MEASMDPEDPPPIQLEPVVKRVDDFTGQEISLIEWATHEWLDVTTQSDYKPGVHRYRKLRRIFDPTHP